MRCCCCYYYYIYGFASFASLFGGRGNAVSIHRGRIEAAAASTYILVLLRKDALLVVHRERLPPPPSGVFSTKSSVRLEQPPRPLQYSLSLESAALLLLLCTTKDSRPHLPTDDVRGCKDRSWGCCCCQSMHSHVLRKSPIIGLLLEAGIVAVHQYTLYLFAHSQL